MRRSREPFWETPPKNPLPPNAKEITGSVAQKGYTVMARAVRGQPRQPMAQRDFSDGPMTGEVYSDR